MRVHVIRENTEQYQRKCIRDTLYVTASNIHVKIFYIHDRVFTQIQFVTHSKHINEFLIK